MFVQDNNKPILLQFRLINCFSHKNMANSNLKKTNMIFFVILEGNDIFVKTIFNKKIAAHFALTLTMVLEILNRMTYIMY